MSDEEAEQVINFIDNNETKEEENFKENEVIEDPFQRINEMLTNMMMVLEEVLQ